MYNYSAHALPHISKHLPRALSRGWHMFSCRCWSRLPQGTSRPSCAMTSLVTPPSSEQTADTSISPQRQWACAQQRMTIPTTEFSPIHKVGVPGCSCALLIVSLSLRVSSKWNRWFPMCGFFNRHFTRNIKYSESTLVYMCSAPFQWEPFVFVTLVGVCRGRSFGDV